MTRIYRTLALTALLTAAAVAQSPNLTDGKTYVTLRPGFISAAQQLGLTLGVVAPTQIVQGTAGFPITAGTLELDNAKGEILHSGGLTIAKGSTLLRLQDYIIDTASGSPVITGVAVLNGKVLGRIPLFNVQLPSNFTLPIVPKSGVVDLKYPELTLTSTAANALNQVFGTSAFKAGFDVAFARIIAAANNIP